MALDTLLSASAPQLARLDERSREIFRQIVETYLATGEPAGSRNISRLIPMTLSPASVRNVMADLEAAGLIYAPHTSAGRLPTELGLRFFVDALLEIGDVSEEERKSIETQVRAAAQGQTVDGVLAEASNLLSGLTRGAGVVTSTKSDGRLKHIEFVPLDPARALLILVSEDGEVENRLVPLPTGLPSSALVEATNFLNARTRGRTLAELRSEVERTLAARRAELDELTAHVVETGLASWSGGERGDRRLIVRGQTRLLHDLKVVDLLGRAEEAQGLRIFIGSENKLFSLSGSSTIVAPYRDGQGRVLGVLGVIGPTRLNYARIVPMVDFTARVVGRVLSRSGFDAA